MDDVFFRRATQEDAEEIAEVYLTSRKEFLSFAPVAHSDQAVRTWVADRLIPCGNVTVSVVDGVPGKIVGMMALSSKEGVGWIDHLYLLPTAVGRGLGSRFVHRAKADLGAPIRLYTFQANDGARRFYKRHGFQTIEYGDGSCNEERCPDVLLEWNETENGHGA